MKFDTDTVLLTREGTAVVEPTVGVDGRVVLDENGEPVPKKLTFGIVAVRAIDAQIEGDDKLTREVVRKRSALVKRIMKGGIIDLANDESNLICDRVLAFGLMVADQILDVLDPIPTDKPN